MQAVAHSPEFAAKVDIPQSVGREFTEVGADAARPLYVRRPLLNTREFLAWAILQGFDETLKAEDLHVTVAFSKASVDWDQFKGRENIAVAFQGQRTVEALGDKGAVCLCFESAELAERHRTFEDGGASWDWPQYRPHVTITYFGAGVDLAKVTPYDGPLEFGPEIFEEIDPNWADRVKGIAQDCLALDRATVRSKDADGHLRVEITPISKANVCPYYGREIPGWQALGLDAERVYNLYRDPEELAKGAKTFVGKPVLSIHKGVRADDHPREIVVGAVGDNVVFDPPYLKAPLTIWDGEAIAGIESGEQEELSSSYRYTPVMTPGNGPDGQRYDGRMTEITGNHVALVEHGRAGPDVLVQDTMPAGLAATDPNSAIPAGGGKRAPAHDDKETEMSKAKDGRARDEGLMERIKGSVSAEDYAALDEILTAGKASDEEAEEDKKADDEEAAEAAKKADDEAAGKEDDDKANDAGINKAAMDAAIATSVTSAVANERKNQAEIREAERFIRPWLGDLAVAYDSAPDVYKAAIEANGHSVKGVHPSAYRAILEMIPKPGEKQRQAAPRLAMDAAKANGFAERFPDTKRVGISLR